MVQINLSDQLEGHVFAFVVLFARLGSMMMLLPGFGEAYVASRIRLIFALGVTLLLLPVLMPLVPPMPQAIPALGLLMAREVLVGVFVGSFLRLLTAAIETAGAIIAVQLGLSNAMVLNPSQANQSAIPSAFLGTAAVTMLFVSGLDHLLVRGMVAVYDVFPMNDMNDGTMVGDMTQAYVRMVGKSFLVGVELAAPFLVVGLLLFLALGFMQRMVAQVQLFLVALPIQIYGGLALFSATIGAILIAWTRFFDASLSGLLVR